MRCPNCTRRMNPKQLIRLVWKKENRYTDVCPFCIKDYMKTAIPEINVNKKIQKALNKDNTDIKGEMQRWTKDLFETF